MVVKDYFIIALHSLRTNKSRSALTILGIVIGIAAVILVMSLGKSAENFILSQIQSIGAKTVVIVPGRQPKGPADVLATFTDSLKARDIDVLLNKSNVPHLSKIMPIVFGTQTVLYKNETYRPTILGVTDLFADIYNIYPAQGRIFSEDEIRGYADVALIGSKVKNELFGTESALGEKIKIKGKNFRIIGIFDQKGQFAFLNFDEIVVVPYTTAQQYIFGIKYFNRILVEADAEENVNRTVEDIKTTLRVAHNITDPSKDDFFIETQARAMETVGNITLVLTIFLASVAAISLLVGGVGIMNIMFVSVTERTKEIGLRKAVGATEKNILLQFLFEAIILTLTGGIIGIILGLSVSFLVSFVLSKTLILGWKFVFPVQAVILGLGVAAFVGFAFGFYPAKKAAIKNPIEALRYE